MQRAIVTVKLQDADQEYDLEVPTDVPAQELADLITFNLRRDRSARLPLAVHCLKPAAHERRLEPQQSLAEAGLWDGCYLVIEPAGAETPKEWAFIIRGWEPIGLIPPPADRGAPASLLPGRAAQPPDTGHSADRPPAPPSRPAGQSGPLRGWTGPVETGASRRDETSS